MILSTMPAVTSALRAVAQVSCVKRFRFPGIQTGRCQKARTRIDQSIVDKWLKKKKKNVTKMYKSLLSLGRNASDIYAWCNNVITSYCLAKQVDACCNQKVYTICCVHSLRTRELVLPRLFRKFLRYLHNTHVCRERFENSRNRRAGLRVQERVYVYNMLHGVH